MPITNSAERLIHNSTSNHTKLFIAIAYNGSRVLSYGFNSYKSEPMIKAAYDKNPDSYFETCNCHAEVAALKKAKGKVQGLIVIRKTRDGSLANSQPCALCQAILIQSGVKEVYFTNEQGEYRRMRFP